MTVLPNHIELLFFKTLKGDTPIRDFEQWLYASRELESLLPGDEYLDFIALSYKASGARYELAKLLRRHIDHGRYETWKLKQLLTSVLNRTGDYPRAIIDFYDLYCNGYRFLETLAFGFGLPLDSPMSLSTAESYEQLTVKERDYILNMYYPAIEGEVQKVIDWLDSGSIVLTGMTDELGHFGFVDKRSLKDKEFTTHAWDEYRPSSEPKKWWKFWK